MSASTRRLRSGETVAVFEFDADECRNVAACMPSGDRWEGDLLEAADELDRLNAPDPDAPGLIIVATFADGITRRLA